MKLNDPLIRSITFNGQKYPIDLSFNNVLDVLEILNNPKIISHKKLAMMIHFLIGSNDLNVHEQMKLWDDIRKNHIKLDEEEIEYDLEGNPMPRPTKQDDRTMDLEKDAKYIYASFRQIGINLFREQNKMHWEEFQAILESLPDDTILQKIISIRVWKPQKGDSAQYKAQMKKLQEKYSLREVVEEDE